MTVTANLSSETVEAVIISGPRKGELINIGPDIGGAIEVSPAAEAMLDILVADAQRMAESARAAAAEVNALLQDLRQVGSQLQ